MMEVTFAYMSLIHISGQKNDRLEGEEKKIMHGLLRLCLSDIKC